MPVLTPETSSAIAGICRYYHFRGEPCRGQELDETRRRCVASLCDFGVPMRFFASHTPQYRRLGMPQVSGK